MATEPLWEHDETLHLAFERSKNADAYSFD